MRECGIFGGIGLFLAYFPPIADLVARRGDFPTTSWHLSRLVALIAPHEFGGANSSATFDWSIGMLGDQVGRPLPHTVHRASAAEMCSYRLRVFFNRIAAPPAQLTVLDHAHPTISMQTFTIRFRYRPKFDRDSYLSA
jgi:hypothetical protein